jgi:hypothetical protein
MSKKSDNPPSARSVSSNKVSPDSTAKADLIAQYAQVGFTVFKLKEDRTPAKNGWQETPYDSTPRAGEFPHGFGVVLEPQDVVLDYDPRRDKDGTQLRSLWDKLDLPKADTFIVRTGRGGVHIYYYRSETDTTPLRSTVPGYPAIEIKSAGRYVVGAGSPHHKGKNYVIERGGVDGIAEIPRALLDVCYAADRGVAESDFIADDEFTKRRFIQYCTEIEPGGNAYVTACKGREFGLTDETVYEIMHEHYSPRCTPPQDDDELRTKIANAFMYARNAQGADHPNSDFGEPEPEAAAAKASKAENPAKGFGWDWAPGGKFKLLPTLRNVMNFVRMTHYREMVLVDGRLIGNPNAELAPNELHQLVRFNQHSGKIEFSRPAPWHNPDNPRNEWSNQDAIMLKSYIGESRPLVPGGKDLMTEAAFVASQDNQYHPVKDMIRAEQWDGIERVDRWLAAYCRTYDNDYTREIGKNWLIGMVARVFEPGCKHDEMVILEGEEGIRKSTVAEALAGEYGRSVKIDPSTQNGYVRTVSSMLGAWLIEIAEMEAFRRAEMDAFKAFMSEKKDTVRLAYEPNDRTILRNSIFYGSINPGKEGYLKNISGNRRFQPVACQGDIDIDGIIRDRAQLFAEAFVRFRAGEPHHIVDTALQAVAKRERATRIEIDAWMDIIADWLYTHQSKMPPDGFKLDYIASAALNLSPAQMGRQERVRLGDALRAAGYENKNANGIRRWFKTKTVDFI